MKTRAEQMAFLAMLLEGLPTGSGRDRAIAFERRLRETGHLALVVCSSDDRATVAKAFEDIEMLGGGE
jgi:hypothetical protein